MKLETSRTFGNATYLLTDREIAAVLADRGLRPKPGSPLGALDLTTLSAKLPDDAAALADPLGILAAPDRTIAVWTWPAGGEWIRYRARQTSPNYVMHSHNADTGANMLIWPVVPNLLKSMIAAPLNRGAPAEAAFADLSLSFREFLVLASLVDRLQEIVWHGFADRVGSPAIRFDRDAVEASYGKGLRDATDPRWMVSRLATGLGSGMPSTLDQIPAVLNRFVAIGLLMEDVDGFAPLPSSELIFRQLADVEGLAAVVVGNGGGRHGAEVRRIYQANRWQIWRYAFDKGLAPDARVQLANVSSDDLSAELDALLNAGAAMPAAQPAASAGTCPSCGAAVTAGQKFCAECGTPVGVAAPAAVQAKCTHCGATLTPGLKFCTQCGHPVGS